MANVLCAHYWILELKEDINRKTSEVRMKSGV